MRIGMSCGLLLSTVLSVSGFAAVAQTPASNVQQGRSNQSAQSTASGMHRGRRRATRTLTLQAPAATATTAATGAPGQTAADAALLQQQEQRSNHDAAVNNRVINAAQSRQDAVQSQQRIQSVPGPSQGVLVPGVAPVAGTGASSRDIQEAPGPAQTAPIQAAPVQTTPTQPTPPQA